MDLADKSTLADLCVKKQKKPELSLRLFSTHVEGLDQDLIRINSFTIAFWIVLKADCRSFCSPAMMK